jgi:hypothetical protein
MRMAVVFAAMSPLAVLAGLLWPWGGSAMAQAAMPGFIASTALIFSLIAIGTAGAVRGAGRRTVLVMGLAGLTLSAIVAGGMPGLFLAIGGASVLITLFLVPMVVSAHTIRISSPRTTLKLYPATAARVEIIRDQEGVLAIRHPDGRVLARGTEAVHLLQAIAGPLIDHGLLWGGDAAAGTPPLSAEALGDVIAALVPRRTTLPLLARALPMEVWEGLLALAPGQFPLVATRVLPSG